MASRPLTQKQTRFGGFFIARRKVMAETARLVIAVDSTQVGRADADLKKFGQTTAAVERQSDSLSSAVSRLAGPLAALTAGVSIKGLIDISDNYGQMADRIRMATDSTQEYVMVQDRLLQSANKTYRPLVEAQELYIRTADAIRSLGYETSGALDITDSFSYLLVTNAASADRASSAVNAYSKAIQTGKVDSESWQSLLAAMPSVVETLASELGKSSNEIRELGITGKLALADLNEGLRRSVEENKRLADGMGTTLNDAIVRASNNWSAYLGESEKVTGASRLMSGALDTVSENLETVAGIASGIAVAAFARYSVSVVQNTSATVLNYRAKQAQAAEELKLAQAQAASTAAALAQARANVGLTASTGQVTAATAAHEAAQKRLAVAQAATMGVGRSMLGLMGGPIGLIATVGLTALSFVEFGDKAKGGMDKAASATEQAAARIRNATRNLLPGDIGSLGLEALQEQAAQIEGELAKARAEAEGFQRNLDAGNTASRPWLELASERVQALEGALAKLKGEMEGVRFASDKAGESYSQNLERQAVLVGKATEEERLRAMVAAGYIKLSKEDLALAIERAKKIDEVTASLKGSTSGVNEQANAYQALYDRLYPAEAAQREYNKQVDLLKKYLSGDQLSKAIDRLNHSMEGADATGPAGAIEEYRKELERLEDKINPAGKAAKDFAAEQARLRAEIERTGDPTGKWTALLEENERQMRLNTEGVSVWAQMTEGAVDRVDSAFADMWRNVFDGTGNVLDGMKNAIKQWMAEVVHMLTTKALMTSVGNWLMGTNNAGGIGQVWGSLLGGGSSSGGGYGIQDGLSAVSAARNAYSLYSVGLAGMANTWGGYLAGAGNMLGMTGLGNFGIGMQGATLAPGLAGPTTIGAGGSMGAGAQVGSGLSSMGGLMANPATWIAAGMLASAKFYDAGYRLDTEDVARQKANKMSFAIDPALSGLLNLGVKTTELATKLLGGGKLANILTGGSLIAGVTGAVDKALFGGAWKTKDYGLGLSIADGDFGARQFEYRKKKGGLLSSSKKKTIWRDLDPETAAALQETYDATESGVASLFEALSLSVEEGSLAGLQLAREQISTKGKTEEQIQEAIGEWFASAAEAMNAELNKVFGTGLDYDLAGMQAFVGNLQGVNEVLRYLDVEMYDASVAGGKLAESLSSVAGGLDALAANSQAYYAAFFTEAEKVEDTIDSIKRAFESADVELASSREAYRAMVEDIDLTTEAGREMFATLMALSGQAAQYFSIVEQQAAQATAALFGAVDTAYAALQRSIAAQQQEIQQAASATASNINALTGVSNSLDAALKKLRGTSDETVKSLRAQAVMTLNSALVQARSGKSLAGFEGLQDAIDVASQMDTALYGSLEDFEREQGRTANLIAELEKVNGKQLKTEQLLLKELEKQSAQLNAELDFAQAQLDALNGIDASVKSVEAAVAAMNASVVAALSGMADGLASKNTAANNSALIDSVYKSVLGRETDEAGAAFWQQQLASGNLDYDQLAKAIANDASKNPNDPGAGSAADYLKNQGGLSVQDQVEAAYRAALGRSADAAGESYWMGQVSSGAMSAADLIAAIERDAKINGEIPGFAAGGFHSGGLRLVGENGPELEVTGPSRIYNASQTAAMLSGGADTAAAITRLQQSVERQGDALRSIAKHTMQTAKRVEFLERWDFDGLPKERATA